MMLIEEEIVVLSRVVLFNSEGGVMGVCEPRG